MSNPDRPASGSGATGYQQGQGQDPGYQQGQGQDPGYQQGQGQDPGYQQGQGQGPGYQQEAGGSRVATAHPQGRSAAQYSGGEYVAGGRHAEERGAVVTFTAIAATLMIIGGLWSVIVGSAALASGHYYVRAVSTGYTYAWNLHNWGWAWICLGIIAFAAGVCIFLGQEWARIVGIVGASVSAIGNFMFIPYQPVWSIILIVLDGFIIWALLAPRYRPGQI
jgi:hypothetical protein